MVYNNTGKVDGMENAWGLSAWIDDAGDITLFDTGGDPKVLEHNLSELGLDPGKINRVIISHDHWDHNGGIGLILEKLLPLAEKGLRALGIENDSICHYLNIIRERTKTGQTGAVWQIKHFEKHHGDLHKLTADYKQHQFVGNPVHTWT